MVSFLLLLLYTFHIIVGLCKFNYSVCLLMWCALDALVTLCTSLFMWFSPFSLWFEDVSSSRLPSQLTTSTRTRVVFRSNGNVLLLLLHLPVLFKYFILAALLLEMAHSASSILGPRKLEINWLQCVTCNHLLLLPPSSSWLRGGQLQLCLSVLLTVESQRIFPFLSCGISINCLPDFYF